MLGYTGSPTKSFNSFADSRAVLKGIELVEGDVNFQFLCGFEISTVNVSTSALFRVIFQFLCGFERPRPDLLIERIL